MAHYEFILGVMKQAIP